MPLLQEFECGPSGSFAATSYLDQGRACLGWGHNIFSKADPLLHMAIDRAKADELALGDLQEAAEQLQSELGAGTVGRLSEGQWAALLDFVFNEGIGAFVGSDMYKLIMQNRMEDAGREFGRWIYITDRHGQKLISAGLVRRRALEAALWNASGSPSSDFLTKASTS